MGHGFENTNEVELDASQQQVWEAISTGPGIDSWFMGNNVVEPGPDGVVRLSFGGYTPEQPITAWEPGTRLRFEDRPPDAEGRFVAYEFLIEGRDGGSTVLRMVTSGFLPGDDWDDEYEAMTHGGELFWRTLVTYLSHPPYTGRTATPVTVFGPTVRDWDEAWGAIHGALELAEPVRVGDGAVVPPAPALPGSAPAEGHLEAVVYCSNAQTLGIRTDGAIYRILQGFQGQVMACHHLFDGTDPKASERRWQGWLEDVLTATTEER